MYIAFKNINLALFFLSITMLSRWLSFCFTGGKIKDKEKVNVYQMDKERVKFYSRSDYFYSYMLNKALEKIRIFDINKETYSLEEILEL